MQAPSEAAPPTIAAVLGILAAVLLVWSLPPSLIKFDPELTPSGSGLIQNVDPFVNLTIRFDTPAAIDPAKFVIEVSPTNGSVNPFNGSRVASVFVIYHSSSNPRWLTTFPGGDVWSGYSAMVTNPGGRSIGGLPVKGWSRWDSSPDPPIDSGATLTLVFPMGSSFAGALIVVTYAGGQGSGSCRLG